jgi:3-oxoacyl-[acyl-carrier-protein] synthase III
MQKSESGGNVPGTPVYITDLATFLPNDPVENEQMEALLGMVGEIPSRTRKIILRNNKIQRRHYALDPVTGAATHSNAQLAAEAVRRLKPYGGFSADAIELLSCGTSSPDQNMPGHASMVHGELASPPCEVVSTAGVCVSGMTAFKYAWMNVALGLSANSVAVGSERASSYMHARVCGGIDADKAEALESQPALSFEADFLRWMLSDGAGAAFLTAQRPAYRQALRVDWVEQLSFAGQMETCMYAGAVKGEDGTLRGWRDFPSLQEAVAAEAFPVKQDVKLLNREIITTCVERALVPIVAKHQLRPDTIDWFLPHYSSDYFRQSLHDHMRDIDFDIPQERWFTNLAQKGNTGAASIYIMLEELFHSHRLRPGQRLLCFIPESGRFSICYMHLTVV